MDLTRANFVRGFRNIRQRTAEYDDTSNTLTWQSATGLINERTSTAYAIPPGTYDDMDTIE
jgi:hypothetical protein